MKNRTAATAWKQFFTKCLKPALLIPASFAVAFATIVFPHPGGPYNKTPLNRESLVKEYIFTKCTLILSSNNPFQNVSLNACLLAVLNSNLTIDLQEATAVTGLECSCTYRLSQPLLILILKYL